MSQGFHELQVGRKVEHPELGEGVVVGFEPTGFVRVFFRSLGERQVPLQALQEAESWSDRVIAGLKPVTPEAIERLGKEGTLVQKQLLPSLIGRKNGIGVAEKEVYGNSENGGWGQAIVIRYFLFPLFVGGRSADTSALS